jgi:hypothetical protein
MARRVFGEDAAPPARENVITEQKPIVEPPINELPADSPIAPTQEVPSAAEEVPEPSQESAQTEEPITALRRHGGALPA